MYFSIVSTCQNKCLHNTKCPLSLGDHDFAKHFPKYPCVNCSHLSIKNILSLISIININIIIFVLFIYLFIYSIESLISDLLHSKRQKIKLMSLSSNCPAGQKRTHKCYKNKHSQMEGAKLSILRFQRLS